MMTAEDRTPSQLKAREFVMKVDALGIEAAGNCYIDEAAWTPVYNILVMARVEAEMALHPDDRPHG